MRAAILVIALILCGCGRSAGETGAPDTPREDVLADLRQDLAFLSSDALLGRLIGESGVTQAEDYIADQFAQAGLEPLTGTETMFQTFTVSRTRFDPGGVGLEAFSRHGQAVFSGWPGEDFRPLPFSRAGTAEGELVFAGYGISAPAWGYDNYANLDVSGKVVVVLRGEPTVTDTGSPFYGDGSTIHAYFKTKAEAAYRRGARGIIVVNPPSRPERPTDFVLFSSFELSGKTVAPPELTAQVGADFVALFSSSRLLSWIAAQVAVPASEIVAGADADPWPGGVNLSMYSARLQVERTGPEPDVPARNVVAMIPGSDPGRIIVVGAHHDHLGTTLPDAGTAGAAPDSAGATASHVDTIFNGADDNASGVAVVLDVARQLVHAQLEPTIVFVTFSGEEQGLLGSTAFVSSGLLNLSNVELMINVDMAARNAGQPVLLYHSDDMPVDDSRLTSIAESAGLTLNIAREGVGGSDQLPFEQSGVPVLFPFSGFHDDYHGVDDEIDRLSFDRLTAITAFVREIVIEVAQ